MRRALSVIALAAALCGCALLPGAGPRDEAAERARAEAEAAERERQAAQASEAPERRAAEATRAAAAREASRGLPICPGDPRCKKPG